MFLLGVFAGVFLQFPLRNLAYRGWRLSTRKTSEVFLLGVFAGVFLQFPLGNLAYQEVLRAVVPFPNRDRKIGTVKNRAYHGAEKKGAVRKPRLLLSSGLQIPPTGCLLGSGNPALSSQD